MDLPEVCLEVLANDGFEVEHIRAVCEEQTEGVAAIFVTSLLRLFSRNLVTLIAFRKSSLLPMIFCESSSGE